jgi:hypothetical protein
VVGFCEHGYESSGSIKGREFLDWLKERQLASQEGLCSMALVRHGRMSGLW